MMMAGRHIHVGKVKIRAPQPAAAQRFRRDFEDALRTTTLPDHPSGAMLYVRRLNLGRLRGGMSRQALSAHLAHCLAVTPITVMRWKSPQPAADAQVVQIPDIVTAAAFALRAAIDRQKPHWAIARVFPHLAHADNPATAITDTFRILIAAASTAAPGRIAALEGGLSLVIQALEMLSTQELDKLSEPAVADLPFTPKGPADLTPPALPTRIRTARKATDTHPTQSDIALYFATAAGPLQTAAQQIIPRWGTADVRTSILLTWIALANEGSNGSALTKQRLKKLLTAVQHRARQSKAPDTAPDLRQPTRDMPAADTPHQTESAPGNHPSTMPVETVKLEQCETPVEPPDGLTHPFAGFWLLIPVLKLLACDHAEEALGIPLMRAILGRFAARLGLAPCDPVYEVLDPELLTDIQSGARDMWAPHPTVLHHIAGHRGLFAHEKGNCTALSLRPKTPAFAQLFTSDLPEGLLIQHTEADTVFDPVTGFTLAAQRLITQLLGGHGWRWLIQRRGPITITPTHIDVVFDGRDANAEVRIAGLDLNPGWVPALGRVVQFHYDYRQIRDHEGPPDE